ncbi:MAG: hypothetical protein ACU833_03480 [Gammaproteobacteria bacterium]
MNGARVGQDRPRPSAAPPLSLKSPLGLFYTTRLRTERIIILGRIALGSFSLLAVWLDPIEPEQTAAY